MHIRKNKSKKNDAGLSPVIGIILMVAITVMMAAIVSSWSSGVKASNTPRTVGLDIPGNLNNTVILVTSIDPPSAAPLQLLNISYQYGNDTSFNPDNATSERVIITATYKDGSKKVLFNQEV